MYKTIRWACLFLFSGLLAGCSALVDSTSNEEKELSVEGFSIETDQEVYLAEEGDNPVEITYAFVNEGKQAFYPGSCLGLASDRLEKLIDGEWVLVYDTFCARPLGPPIKIERGQRYEVIIQLHPSTWDSERNNTSWKGGDIEGTYRVRELIYEEWSMKKFDEGTLRSEIAFSNPFEIRREP